MILPVLACEKAGPGTTRLEMRTSKNNVLFIRSYLTVIILQKTYACSSQVLHQSIQVVRESIHGKL